MENVIDRQPEIDALNAEIKRLQRLLEPVEEGKISLQLTTCVKGVQRTVQKTLIPRPFWHSEADLINPIHLQKLLIELMRSQ
jgi:hypothetical protein